MSVTPSSMLSLGTSLPSFELVDTVSGASVASDSLRGSVAVVLMICNHCPFVVHIKEGMRRFGEDYDRPGVKIVAISSNNVATHPMDGPEAMAQDARRQGYKFPYLWDESQTVALAFQARCTPEFYVFDPAGKLAYRGQFDDSRPNQPTPVTGADVRAAVDALLAGERPAEEQRPSVGCSIKWKPGLEPA